MDDKDLKWFFNQETGEVEQGLVSAYDKRMGPYDSKEEAERALEIVAERNAQADEWDKEDEEE